VTLNEKGEVDFSSVKIANLRAKLESNPQVQLALMMKEMQFEFPHKEAMMKEAQTLKRRLEDLEEQATKAKANRSKSANEALQQYIQEQLQKEKKVVEGTATTATGAATTTAKT
jgi:predicted transcriptional regulator